MKSHVKALYGHDLNMSTSFPGLLSVYAAFPPLSKEHIEINKMFAKMSRVTKTNMISTKVFTDENTGKIRPDTMKVKKDRSIDFHYNDYGIKLLAKEIGKSLYSSSNIQSNELKKLHKIWLDSKAYPGTTH